MTIIAHTDGASRGNPGKSGIGIVMKDEQGQVIRSIGGYIGNATNNIAEYVALLTCLKKAMEIDCTRLIVHSDSQLLVRQMQGLYRVRDSKLKNYHKRVHSLLAKAAFKFDILHVSREQNREADLLANAGIDSRRKV